MAPTPWEIAPASSEDTDTMYRLLETSFFCQEPAMKRLFEEEGLPPLECCMSIQALGQGLSFKVLSASGEVIAAALNLNKESLDDSKIASFEPMQKMLSFFNFVDDNSLGHEKNWLTIQVLTVHPSWRRLGIAEALVQATVELSAKKKYRGVRVMCTSVFTARLFEKKGWELVYSLPYAEYKNSEGGTVFCPDPPHNAVSVYVKRNDCPCS